MDPVFDVNAYLWNGPLDGESLNDHELFDEHGAITPIFPAQVGRDALLPYIRYNHKSSHETGQPWMKYLEVVYAVYETDIWNSSLIIDHIHDKFYNYEDSAIEMQQWLEQNQAGGTEFKWHSSNIVYTLGPSAAEQEGGKHFRTILVRLTYS